jgi:hypothetical protein
MRPEMQRIFSVRTNLSRLGIGFNPATKRNLSVSIGSEFAISAPQVLGGDKRGKDGGDVAVPTVGPGSPRRTAQSITRPDKWPKALVAKNDGTFIGTAKTKGGEVRGVWRRVWRDPSTGKIMAGGGEGMAAASSIFGRHRVFFRHGDKKRQARPGLKLLYELRPSVHIDARWPLLRQVETVWAARWPSRIDDALDYAFRTSHEKAGRAHVAGMRYGTGTNQFRGVLVAGRF